MTSIARVPRVFSPVRPNLQASAATFTQDERRKAEQATIFVVVRGSMCPAVLCEFLSSSLSSSALDINLRVMHCTYGSTCASGGTCYCVD